MDTVSFVFAMTGIALAGTAMTQVASLKNELEELKKKLESSGALKEQTESDDKSANG